MLWIARRLAIKYPATPLKFLKTFLKKHSSMTTVRHFYKSYKKARRFARDLNLPNIQAWRSFCKTRKKPDWLPACPEKVYRDAGWSGYPDWLGVARPTRNFLPYSEANKFVHTLGLKSKSQWRSYCDSEKIPPNIPKDPYTVYRNRGYVSMSDWLGSGILHTRERFYWSFSKSRAWVRKQKIKTTSEWFDFARSGNLPEEIPRAPHAVYKDRWKSYPDWLGNKGFALPRYRPDRNQNINRKFVLARKFARALDLQTKEQWIEYTQSGQCPLDIPSDPRKAYDDYWVDWADWLGN